MQRLSLSAESVEVRIGRVEVLVLSGPAGVGKSSTAHEVSYQLRASGVPHAVIDTDELDHLHPAPEELWRLTERNLSHMWRAFREHGADRLILIGVFLDQPGELEWISRAVPGARFTCVRLTASASTLLDRVNRREIGSDRESQVDRTIHQLSRLEGVPGPRLHGMDTDQRTITETASAIIEVWLRGNRS